MGDGDSEAGRLTLGTGNYEMTVGAAGGRKVLGSREFALYYKQRHRAVDTRQSVTVNAVLARCAPWVPIPIAWLVQFNGYGKQPFGIGTMQVPMALTPLLRMARDAGRERVRAVGLSGSRPGLCAWRCLSRGAQFLPHNVFLMCGVFEQIPGTGHRHGRQGARRTRQKGAAGTAQIRAPETACPSVRCQQHVTEAGTGAWPIPALAARGWQGDWTLGLVSVMQLYCIVASAGWNGADGN